MKIKTITCHDVYNAGASLQTYAFNAYIRGLGYDAEIIDYKPDYLMHYRLFGVTNPKYNRPFLREIYQAAKFPERLKQRFFSKKKRAFDCFTAQLPLTKRYNSNEALKIDPPEADVYFAGSDQIWNTSFKNGQDPAFYLDFVPPGKIKASYAASFATEDVEEAWKPQVKKWLSGLDFIAVRESSGLRILRNLGIENAVHVCDPVFLLAREEWEKAAKPLRLEKPYLLVYDFDRNPRIKNYCLTAAKQYGWRICSVLYNDYSECCFDDEGPASFLTLVKEAEYIVSNSFHAAAFSLIFEKPFAVFRREEKINTRMEDLLSMLGLERLLEPAVGTIEQVDYSAVRPRLEDFVKESKAYIDTVLKGNRES
ncbi:MAG: polysaccharide pyruvyl transferase family protein [Clostridia bacterium]|nr:polysaccharide pyruvyl transferase family protein [Clostridia bacterium]